MALLSRNIKSGSSNQSPSIVDFRHSVALLVLLLSIGGLLMLSFMVLYRDKTIDNARYVFGAVLPLVGTWVGTVLAFYFSRENFESASRSIREMAEGVSGLEKLKSIPVKEAMLTRTEINSFSIQEGKENLVNLVDLMKNFPDHERMPLLDNDRLIYLVYKSEVNRFLADITLDPTKAGGKNIGDLTFQDLLDSDVPALKDLFRKSAGFVEETATLDKAKAVMDAITTQTKCKDVFVTRTGDPNETIIGWITNNEIARHSKV